MDKLPPELWDYVLSCCPDDALQSTTWALLCALRANISPAALWRHVHLTREGQAWLASKALKLRPECRSSVVTARAEAWREDPQLLVNFLIGLDRVKMMRLCVGPLFAPDHLEELLEKPSFQGSISELWLRFNPYVQERSYYSFMKGAYFDSAVLTLARWRKEDSRNLRRLAFVQDLPPNHGSVRKETPAFGIQPLPVDESENQTPEDVQRSTDFDLQSLNSALDFAQPIVSACFLSLRLPFQPLNKSLFVPTKKVFFKLQCLTVLATSLLGSQLTHLVLRLPRRNVLRALTMSSSSTVDDTIPKFPSLLHIDLSTTHIVPDLHIPLFLRLYPSLEHVSLDRCTGIIGPRERTEPATLATLRFLGKCFGGVGASRAGEVSRAWKRLAKENHTGSDRRPSSSAPGGSDRRKRPSVATRSLNGTRIQSSTSTTTALAQDAQEESTTAVKDVMIIPPLPKTKSLGMGLFPIDTETAHAWILSFMEGYDEAMTKTQEKIEEVVHRWKVWQATGKLIDGTRRLVCFRDDVVDSTWLSSSNGGRLPFQEVEEEPDEVLKSFCAQQNLVVVTDVDFVRDELLTRFRLKSFTFCTVADCTNAPGVPHVSLSNIAKDTKAQQRLREKLVWERERAEQASWKRPSEEHRPCCSHLASRDAWCLQ